jgi:hypothetical protein
VTFLDINLGFSLRGRIEFVEILWKCKWLEICRWRAMIVKKAGEHDQNVVVFHLTANLSYLVLPLAFRIVTGLETWKQSRPNVDLNGTEWELFLA